MRSVTFGCLKIHQTFGDAIVSFKAHMNGTVCVHSNHLNFCANAVVSFVNSVSFPFVAGCCKSAMSFAIKKSFFFSSSVLSSSLVATVPYRQHATMRIFDVCKSVLCLYIHYVNRKGTAGKKKKKDI